MPAGVVVDLDPRNRASARPGLGSDDLGDEHAAHVAERGVELRRSMYGRAARPRRSRRALDLDGDDAAVGVADTRSIGPIAVGYSRRTSVSAVLDRGGRQQRLQVGLDAVLLQAGSAEVVQRIGATSCSVIVSRSPLGFVTTRDRRRLRCRGVHPVQRLVGPAVGVDRHAAVGLDHDQPQRRRQVGRQRRRSPPSSALATTSRNGDGTITGRRLARLTSPYDDGSTMPRPRSRPRRPGRPHLRRAGRQLAGPSGRQLGRSTSRRRYREGRPTHRVVNRRRDGIAPPIVELAERPSVPARRAAELPFAYDAGGLRQPLPGPVVDGGVMPRGRRAAPARGRCEMVVYRATTRSVARSRRRGSS